MGVYAVVSHTVVDSYPALTPSGRGVMWVRKAKVKGREGNNGLISSATPDARLPPSERGLPSNKIRKMTVILSHPPTPSNRVLSPFPN